MSWHEDGHSAALVVDDDMLRVRLQCPGDEFCEAKQRCHVCDGARTIRNGPYPPGDYENGEYRDEECPCCGGDGVEPGVCHMMHWADHVDPMEMHQGHTDLYGQTFPAAIRWDYGGEDDGPEWRFAVTYPDEVRDARAA